MCGQMLGQASLPGLFPSCLYLQSERHVGFSVHLSVCVSVCASVSQLSVVLLHLAGVAVETKIHFPLRLEVSRLFLLVLICAALCCPQLVGRFWSVSADSVVFLFQAIRTFNSILESLGRDQRRLIQNDQNQNQIL